MYPPTHFSAFWSKDCLAFVLTFSISIHRSLFRFSAFRRSRAPKLILDCPLLFSHSWISLHFSSISPILYSSKSPNQANHPHSDFCSSFCRLLCCFFGMYTEIFHGLYLYRYFHIHYTDPFLYDFSIFNTFHILGVRGARFVILNNLQIGLSEYKSIYQVP
jgi:hypothetical protein